MATGKVANVDFFLKTKKVIFDMSSLTTVGEGTEARAITNKTWENDFHDPV